MPDESLACQCPICQGQTSVRRALVAYRHDETGHERGCECEECEQYTRADVREVLGCEYRDGSHQWLADYYLNVIKPNRINLHAAPWWTHELAAIGDSIYAERRRKRRREINNQR